MRAQLWQGFAQYHYHLNYNVEAHLEAGFSMHAPREALPLHLGDEYPHFQSECAVNKG